MAEKKRGTGAARTIVRLSLPVICTVALSGAGLSSALAFEPPASIGEAFVNVGESNGADNSKGGTETNTVSLLAPRCGGNLVLVAASTGALVTESELTAGTVYTVYPSTVNGILRGIVQGI